MTSWERLRDQTLPVATIREVDRIAIDQFHMHSLVLMENASLACARWLAERYSQFGSNVRRAVILCGRGNNGGDGLAIARHMRLLGWQCEVAVLGPIDQLSPDALANWRILTARSSIGCTVALPGSSTGDQSANGGVEHLIDSAEVIVDAMLGSGAKGAPRAPLDHWIELANAAHGRRIAIDIPTGLDAETGHVQPLTFQAEATLTFVARKPGFASAKAQSVLGEVVVMPIGIPLELIDELLAQSTSSVEGGGS